MTSVFFFIVLHDPVFHCHPFYKDFSATSLCLSDIVLELPCCNCIGTRVTEAVLETVMCSCSAPILDSATLALLMGAIAMGEASESLVNKDR